MAKCALKVDKAKKSQDLRWNYCTSVVKNELEHIYREYDASQMPTVISIGDAPQCLLLARRIGAIYLGLSVGFFLARNAPVSVARTALSTAVAIASFLLAFLGVYEFSAGRAGAGILVSAIVESLIGIGYVWILVKERRAKAAA